MIWDCPALSAAGVRCVFPLGHQGPHQGESQEGRKSTWGYKATARPMYTRVYPLPNPNDVLAVMGTQPAAPNYGVSQRCEAVYEERGLTFQCVKDAHHPGELHRAGSVRWTSAR